ncbi:MAG: hypothetical protein Q7J07_02950 [Pelolinea sp.]|nr:hypothetical protein [Pelolinea sp.]
MIKAMIDIMLGKWGRAILDFYFANQTIINIIFVTWGTVITYASLQLNKIRRKTIYLGLDFIKESPDLTDKEVWEALRPRWQEEISSLKSRLIINRWNFWVIKATPENIIDIMKLGPDWFAALRKDEVLRYRFSFPGENFKVSMFIKNKPK